MHKHFFLQSFTEWSNPGTERQMFHDLFPSEIFSSTSSDVCIQHEEDMEVGGA